MKNNHILFNTYPNGFFLGVNVKDEWKEMVTVIQPDSEVLSNSFTDAHLLMAYMGAEDHEATDKFIQYLKDFIKCVVFGILTSYIDMHMAYFLLIRFNKCKAYFLYKFDFTDMVLYR